MLPPESLPLILPTSPAPVGVRRAGGDVLGVEAGAIAVELVDELHLGDRVHLVALRRRARLVAAR